MGFFDWIRNFSLRGYLADSRRDTVGATAVESRCQVPYNRFRRRSRATPDALATRHHDGVLP